jgi:hypothetical protein
VWALGRPGAGLIVVDLSRTVNRTMATAYSDSREMRPRRLRTPWVPTPWVATHRDSAADPRFGHSFGRRSGLGASRPCRGHRAITGGHHGRVTCRAYPPARLRALRGPRPRGGRLQRRGIGRCRMGGGRVSRPPRTPGDRRWPAGFGFPWYFFWPIFRPRRPDGARRQHGTCLAVPWRRRDPPTASPCGRGRQQAAAAATSGPSVIPRPSSRRPVRPVHPWPEPGPPSPPALTRIVRGFARRAPGCRSAACAPSGTRRTPSTGA